MNQRFLVYSIRTSSGGSQSVQFQPLKEGVPSGDFNDVVTLQNHTRRVPSSKEPAIKQNVYLGFPASDCLVALRFLNLLQTLKKYIMLDSLLQLLSNISLKVGVLDPNISMAFTCIASHSCTRCCHLEPLSVIV